MNSDNDRRPQSLTNVDSPNKHRRNKMKSTTRYENSTLVRRESNLTSSHQCKYCPNSTDLYGRLEDQSFQLVCLKCSKSFTDSIWIPEQIYNQVFNCELFKKFRENVAMRAEIQKHFGNDIDIENYLIFYSSERQISELKLLATRLEYEEFIFYRMVLNFMFPLSEPNKEWCCWNFKKTQILEQLEPEVKEKKTNKKRSNSLKFKRIMSDIIPMGIGKTESMPLKKSPSEFISDIYDPSPKKNTESNKGKEKDKQPIGIPVEFKMTLKGNFKVKDRTLAVKITVNNIKSIPSLLFSTCFEYTRRIDCKMVKNNQTNLGNAWDKLNNLNFLRMNKNDSNMTIVENITDYQPCSECLRTSFIIPLFKINHNVSFKDDTGTEKIRKEEIFYFKNKSNVVVMPPSFEFKLHLRRADKIGNYYETILNYTLRPIFFWKYFKCDFIMFSASILWFLNFIATGFYVYPISVILLMLISYIGFANVCQGSKLRPTEREKRLNIYFTLFIFILYGILSFFFSPELALTLLALWTFVAIYAGIAYYIALQSKNFRDILILTFKGDLESKKYGISNFFKKLNRIELMKALNKVYYQVQVCQKMRERQMVLEVSSSFSFIYVVVIIVFTYFLEYIPLETLGQGKSYLAQMPKGELVYGLMFIFVMLMKTVSSLAKIYFNLEMTDYLEEIFTQFDRMKEVLNFFEVSPESLIEADYLGDQTSDEIVFTNNNMNSNFNIKYHTETNRTLCALQSQLREIETVSVKREEDEELLYDEFEEFLEPNMSLHSDTSVNWKFKAYSIEENEMVTKEKLANWIRHQSKTSRHRIEYVDKEFRALTELVRYKFLGSLEINSSFLIKFGGALAAAAATSLVAVLNISFTV